MPSKKVIVVGAGCAGLSATYTLRKAGVEVVTFEANAAAGGRCRTHREDGYTFSMGAGSTEPQWETTFQYLSELSLLDKVFSIQKQRYAFLHKGKLRTVFLGGDRWESLKTLPENIRFFLSALPPRTWKQVINVSKAMQPYIQAVDIKNLDFAGLEEISKTSTEDFVLKYGGPEALEYIFHPFLATMILGRPQDISIAHPISLFSLMKGMRSLEGGLGSITEALYAKVKDSVRLSTPVRRIVIRDGKVTGVETDAGFVEADEVICAVDAVLARQLIPDLPEAMRKPLETCRYSSTYYYQFGLEKQVLPEDNDFFVVMIPASQSSVLSFIAKGSRKGEKPIIIAPTRGWEDEHLSKLSESERRALVIAEIQRFIPRFPTEPPLTKVFRWDRAINLEAPGQFTAVHDLLTSHMHDVGGLHLAGEYLFLFACTEGALMTGKQAAESVLFEREHKQ